MNYLSNYYKNLAEQLEERINHLTRLIENKTLTPDNHDGPDAGRKGSADEVATWAQEATLEADPGFHDDIVRALSYHLGDAHPHITARDNMYRLDRDESARDIQRTLHGSAPEGGYKTFDHAHDTLGDIVFDGAHHGRNAMYNAINDGIGFDEEGETIINHDARNENAGRILSGARNNVRSMVQSFQDQRGTKRDNAAYFASKPPSNA
jgi:hypothetical protein